MIAQLVLFDQSNNTGAIDVKMDKSVPEEKLSFNKLDWGSHIISIAKTASKTMIFPSNDFSIFPFYCRYLVVKTQSSFEFQNSIFYLFHFHNLYFIAVVFEVLFLIKKDIFSVFFTLEVCFPSI